MSEIQERMSLCETILSTIDRKRAEENDPNLGSAIERAVLDSHIREIEKDILDDPGAMEQWLVRRHVRREGRRGSGHYHS